MIFNDFMFTWETLVRLVRARFSSQFCWTLNSVYQILYLKAPFRWPGPYLWWTVNHLCNLCLWSPPPCMPLFSVSRVQKCYVGVQCSSHQSFSWLMKGLFAGATLSRCLNNSNLSLHVSSPVSKQTLRNELLSGDLISHPLPFWGNTRQPL